MRHNQKIVFQGEADEAPDTIPGDIVFVVQQKDHKTFTRKGDDLFIEKEITLVEALCGMKMTVDHLDGRQLVVSTQEGETIKPGSFKAVVDEGMPKHGMPFQKGRLFIHFTVKFPGPGDLSTKTSRRSKTFCPDDRRLASTWTAKTLKRSTCARLTWSKRSADAKPKPEAEANTTTSDDEGAGGPGVQCAQQ